MGSVAVWKYSVGAIMVFSGLVLGGSQAQAGHIACGSVLGPGGSFMLDGNVGPCSGPGPALTVNRASLDLKGFVVSCAAEIDGIVLLGHGARVKNGTVTACGRGIVPGGSGEHVVRNVTAQSSDYGFWVEEGSDSNKLHANTAQRNSNCR